ncbi:hypothetical protein B0H13DRAFT_1866065 [Mycena leptocephala]|nr:hypothetical protein B0H13DRAFT_1866065 [Mycena leptocephala]
MRDTGYWKGKERSCRSPSEGPGCTAREAVVSERDCTRSRSGSIWGCGGGWGRAAEVEVERLSLIEGVRMLAQERGYGGQTLLWQRVASGPGFGHGRRWVLGWEEQKRRSKEASDAQAMVDGDRTPSRTRRVRPRTRQVRKGVALTTSRRHRHGGEARRGVE